VLPPTCVLEGLKYLAAFLLGQVAILEDPESEDKRRKAVYDKIPSDVIRDPAGLAKELEWRVQRELPKDSVKRNGAGDGEKAFNGSRTAQPGSKKSRGLIMIPPVSRVWQFEPSYVHYKAHSVFAADRTLRPWVREYHPQEEKTTLIRQYRPNTGSEARLESLEKATQTDTFKHQTHVRVSTLDDGSTLQEKQDVKLTITRTMWGPLRKQMTRGKNGDEEVLANGHL